MHKVLFLGEGSSDQGIAVHVERIAAELGIETQVTAPDAAMLPPHDGTVAGKLRSIQRLGGSYAAVFIHRDADRAGREARVAEIRDAVNQVMPGVIHAAVVPVRMTEAWLLLDEQLIREVAGNPNGRVPLRLPSANEAERIADPKALLKELLVTASELTGRRRRSFQAAFPFNRRRLLEELDPGGPVRDAASWQQFREDIAHACTRLHSHG